MKRFMIVGLLFGSACQTISSDELKTTKAQDLELNAVVQEYTDMPTAKIGAQMQTLKSQVGITFTQGETLTAAYQEADAISPAISLSDDTFLNLNKDYEGEVPKTVGVYYYITYTDAEDIATTAAIASGSVSELTSPSSGDALSGPTTTVTWDPNGLKTGTVLRIRYQWSSGNAFGFGQKIVQNTGTHSLDISSMYGKGAISLVNSTLYSTMEGFGGAHVEMENICRKAVTFNSATSKTGKSMTKSDELLHKCLAICEEGEERFIVVNGVQNSCCEPQL